MSMKQTMCEFVHGMSCEEVAKFLSGIVRCRDCRHYHSYQDLCERLRPGMVVMGDGFCAWGERKEGGDD